MHPQMPPQRPMPRQYPQYGQPVRYGPPPGWVQPAPYNIAVTVLYLVAAPLPLITAAVWGEYLATAWEALWDGNINGPGLVILLSLLFSGLLGLSCLSNGIARLVRGKRWDSGAWTALTLATLSLAGLFAMIALMGAKDLPMIGQLVLYFIGTAIAVVAGLVGAFSRK